jgi:hypothetical protein
MVLERVAHRWGNNLAVDTTAKVMGMTKNVRYDIVLHPEGYWLEMTITIEGVIRSRRTYRFRMVPDGTQVLIEES